MALTYRLPNYILVDLFVTLTYQGHILNVIFQEEIDCYEMKNEHISETLGLKFSRSNLSIDMSQENCFDCYKTKRNL